MNIQSYFRASVAMRLFAAILMLGMVATTFPAGAFADDGSSTPAVQPTCSLTANPGSTVSGVPTTLTLTSSGADAATIDNGGGSVSGANGTVTVSPTTDTTYTATVTNTASSTSATCSTHVDVIDPGSFLISTAPITATSGDPIHLSAQLTIPLPHIDISFTVNGAPVGTATTNGSGKAELTYTPSTPIAAGSYPGGITASFSVFGIFNGSNSADLTIVSSSTTPTPPSGPSGPSGPATYTVCSVDGTYTTIQAAVDAEAAGSTITVCAGTYPEDVSVSKPLTIQGANAGVAGDDTRGAESILDGSFAVSANDVTIDGFTIDPSSGSSVTMQGAYTGETITNNVINDNGYAVNFNTGDTTISHNKIVYGPTFTTGVEANSNPAGGLTFDSNVFTGDGAHSPADITVIGNKTSQTSNVTVTGNKSTSGTTLIALFNTDTASIADNTADGAAGSSLVYIGGNDSNVTVNDNKLTNSGTGVNVANDSGDGANNNVTVSSNDLTGNTAGVKVGTTAYTAGIAVEATGNWWGDASGPTDSTAGDGSIPDTNPGGTGSPAVGAVHYANFCTNATCTLSGPYITTDEATGITSSDATLNGTNGTDNADGHSFWVSLSPFDTSSPNIPSGVFSTSDMGSINAHTAFSALLSSLTTNAITTGGATNVLLPAITASTTYYYTAWSRIAGTWHAGEQKFFTTSDTSGGGSGSATTTLAITAPAADGDTASGTYDFTADYENGVTSSLQWAVRTDANCNTGTVAGNVDGHTDASTLSGADFSANLDTTAWTNGNYCFVVNDGHHNRVERHFVVDNTSAPVITSVTPASGSYIRGTTTFTVDASSTNPSYIYVELNKGGTWITDDTKSGHEGASESTLTYDTTKLADGTYTLKVDAVGNGKTTEQNYTYYVDNTKPTVAFTAPTPDDGTYINGNFDVGYTASDNAMLKSVGVSLFDTDSSHSNHWVATCYSNGAEASTTDSGICTVKLPAGIPDGEYYVQVGAQDKALNWSVNAKRTIYVERAVPAAPTGLYAKFQYDHANIADGSTLNKTASTTGNNLELLWTAPWGKVTGYHILATYPDGTTHMSYQGANTNAWLAAYDGFGTHGQGEYDYQVVAVDASGTSAPSETFTLYYDTQSPTAQFDPTPSIHTTGDFTVSGTASDNVALKGVFFDVRDPSITSGNSWVAGCVTGTQAITWGTGSTTAQISCTIDTKNLTVGHTYTLRIHAGDYAGYGGGSQQDLIVDADTGGSGSTPSGPVVPQTVVVMPSDYQGWASSTASGATVGFKADDDAPLGDGALELTTTDDRTSVTHFTHDLDIPLSDLSELSYETKQLAASNIRTGNASVRINIDLDGNGTLDDQLMYEPYYNGFDGTTMTGWQTWDISSTTGKFWSNYSQSYNGHAVKSAGSYATNFTIADVLHDYPNAKITGVVLSMGSGNVSQDVLIDNLHIVSSTSDTTYDFEPTPAPAVTPLTTNKSNGNRTNGGGGGLSFLGRVLGVSTTTVPQGQVLGASCGPTLSSYLWRGNANPADQVTILQNFLNTEMGSALPVTGFFGPLTEAAVKAFQLKYYADILGPWVAYGLPSDHTATGRVYKTTEWKINSLSCPEMSSTTLPQLP